MCHTETHKKAPRCANIRGHGNQKGALISMNTLSLTAEAEAGRLWRRLPAAERRANTARARADRTGTKEHVIAAFELEMGLRRMEAAYYENLALIDDEPVPVEAAIQNAYLRLFEAIRENKAA